MPITLVERYNPNWPQWFDQLKSRSIPGLTADVLTTEHIGNTSVPGMTAKPIIDIDILIAAKQLRQGQIAVGRARLFPLGRRQH